MPNEGYQIQVGDKIKFESGCFGEQTFTVHRVTKCFAFVRYNDVAEGKFRREYAVKSAKLKQHWRTNHEFHYAINPNPVVSTRAANFSDHSKHCR